MPDSNQANTNPGSPKEWTLMFYFASDNPLGPTIVSQLKALKNAGFHPDANVIAYYDPPIPGTPTHIFDVNITEKIKAKGEANIGFKKNGSWVDNLVKDKLWGDQESIDGQKITELIAYDLGELGDKYNPPNPARQIELRNTKIRIAAESAKELLGPEPGKVGGGDGTGDPGKVGGGDGTGDPGKVGGGDGTGDVGTGDTASPENSLGDFLRFCSESYPASNYMLFILGHGLVVGNDVFLYDDSAATHSLSLTNLGILLTEFRTDIKKADEKAEFQLVSFHSCSMSSLEVAYELKDTANYMLAAQCPTYVGNWPYRQILMRVLKAVEREETDVEEIVSDIFSYCYYNGYDFQLAGYSLDLCLCDLRNTAEIKEELSNLSGKLQEGLAETADPRAEDFILLAHWDAQSYWGEMYTDLYDFCRCLKKRCLSAIEHDKAGGNVSATLDGIQKACGKMIDVLEPQSGDSKQLIVRSEFVGPAYQYAHGLSVYFPWSEPFNSAFWQQQYGLYKLIKDDGSIKDEKKSDAESEEALRKRREENPSWQDFLRTYFRKTMRKTRFEEQGVASRSSRASSSRSQTFISVDREALDAMSFPIFANGELGQIGTGDSLGQGGGKVGGADGTGAPGKVGGGDGTGGDFYFSTVKNYPPYTRARQQNGGGSASGKRAERKPPDEAAGSVA